MTDDQIASLNQRLQQLGFATMGDYARALTEGVVGNEQLVEALADRVVNKMLTVQPLPSDAAHAMKSVRSTGFEPVLPAWRADVLDQTVLSERTGRRPHDPASVITSF